MLKRQGYRTIDALPEFDTISVDLYSLGDRTDWREFAGPDGLATAVGGLLDASHIDRCCVIGNSMGGIAAQALAASHTGRVEKIGSRTASSRTTDGEG